MTAWAFRTQARKQARLFEGSVAMVESACTDDALPSSACNIHGMGQNRIYTPYMTVYLVISLPKILCIHRIFMFWLTLNIHGIGQSRIYIHRI